MNTIELTGLDGTNPLGFLAAIGTLRIASEQDAWPKPRVIWRENGSWLPALHTSLDRGRLLDLLLDDARNWRDDPALDLRYPKDEKKPDKPAWDLKPTPTRFRDYLEGLLEARAQRAARYAAAFAAEGVVDNNGATKPFPLHFTAGQQEFLAMVGGLVREDGITRDDLAEALFGPWSYSRPLPVLGWDATATRDYALRATNPSTDKKLGVPGADWLAFRGLGLLRSSSAGTRLETTGCYGGWKNGGFRWPIWDRPCTLRTVEALMNLPDLQEMPARERRVRGIAAVFDSRIRRSDQGGYGSFAPSAAL